MSIVKQVLDLQQRAIEQGVTPTDVYLPPRAYVQLCMELGPTIRFPANTDGKGPAEEYLLGMRIRQRKPTIYCRFCGAGQAGGDSKCSYCNQPYDIIELH